MEILKVEGLKKTYSTGTTAVKGIHFSVNEGDIYALLGPNGAGKTTTIRMLATLLRPSEGDAFIDGCSILKEADQVRKKISYLPDEAGAYKNMTGEKYLKFMANMMADHDKDVELYVARATKICGLGDRLKNKIGSYSRGMTRKLLLARAMMSGPKLAIFDEPTSGLDILNALEIRRMIRGLAKEEGISFLLSSHNMLEIEYIADRVGIISEGNILTEGTISELKERYQANNLEEVFERAIKGMEENV